MNKKLNITFYDYDYQIIISGFKTFEFKDFTLIFDENIKIKGIAKSNCSYFNEVINDDGVKSFIIRFKQKKHIYEFTTYNAKTIKKNFKVKSLSYWSAYAHTWA